VHQSPTPAVDPSELRPRKRAYWIAGIIAGVGIIVGVLGGVGLIVYGASSFQPDSRFTLSGTGNASGNVALTADQEWAVFSTTDASWEIQCTATAGANTASVTDPGEDANFTSGGRTWHEVARVKAPADGTYAFSCRPSGDATSADVGTAEYFVGEAPDIGTFFGGLFGGFVVLFGVPFLTIMTGVIISVVTAVKRSNHRKRLMAERYGPPPGPSYGPPPYAG